MPSELFMSDSVFVFKDLEAAQPGIADVLIILGKIKIVGLLLAIDTREVEEKPFEKSYGNRSKVSHARIIQAEHIPVIEAFHKKKLNVKDALTDPVIFTYNINNIEKGKSPDNALLCLFIVEGTPDIGVF
jgi:hypothetical protein